MKLFKLAFMNVRKSYRDFSIYFLTIAMGICIFYVFNSLETQSSMLELSEGLSSVITSSSKIMAIISTFVSAIFGFLILYANSFLIKRRKREFAIYLTLGMDRQKVALVAMLETVYIGVLSLVFGLAVGLVLSQFMGIITSSLFGIKLASFTIVFSLKATIKTIIYFAGIFIFVMSFNTIVISKYKLITLLNAHKLNKSIKEKSLYVSVVLFLASIIILGLSYHIAITMDVLDNIEVMSIFGGIIGSYLFYYSIAGVLLKLIQSNQKKYFKGLNMFVYRQLNNRMSKTVIATTIISILLFLTLSILASTTSLVNVFSSEVDEMNNYDVSLTSYTVTENIKLDYQLRDNNILDNIEKYASIRFYESDFNLNKVINEELKYDSMADVISLSDYNQFRELSGLKKIELMENECYVLSNVEETFDNWNDLITNNNITINDIEFRPINKVTEKETLFNYSFNTNLGTIVVHDNLILKGSFTTSYDVVNGIYKSEKDKSNISTKESIQEYNEIPENPFVMINSKIDYINTSIGLKMTLTYVGIYIGFIFLVACSTIIALIQLSESDENIKRYSLLYKIGTDEIRIKRSIFQSVFIAFATPLFLALVDSVFGIWVINNVVSRFGINNIISDVIFALIVMLVVYGLYFLTTYYGVKRTILKNLNIRNAE